MDRFVVIINTLSTSEKRLTIKFLKMIVRIVFFKVELLQVASRFGTIVFDWSEDLVYPRSLHATGYSVIFNQGRVTLNTCC